MTIQRIPELPNDLKEARYDDRLVIFTGAGATLGGTAFTSGDLDVILVSSDTTIFSTDAMPGLMPFNQADEYDRFSIINISGSLGGQSFSIDAVITQIPEPSTGLLVALGIAGLSSRRRRPA